MAKQETGERVDKNLRLARDLASTATMKLNKEQMPEAMALTALSQAWATIAQAELMAHVLEQLQKAATFPKGPR